MTSFADLVPGAVLKGIWYELLSWELDPTPSASVDAVAMAVILDFAGATPVRFHWDLRPPVERLATGPRESGGPSPDVRCVDVSARWGRLIGLALDGYTLSFQDTDGGLAPWACRLHFREGDAHLVVALGEKLADEVTYIPDSLIVTDSRSVAVRYRPPAARSSAWGSVDH